MLNGLNVSILVILVGLYGLTNNDNAIKLLMSLSVMGSGIILLFVSVAYIPGGEPPLMTSDFLTVDPIPHSVMITFIVINLATTALGLALALQMHRHYGTLCISKLFGGDDES